MDNLPTRFNLAHRGIDLDSIICPNCNMAAETSIHIFFHCPMAKDIYKRITNWWDINILVASSYEEWCAWFMSLRIPVKLKTYLEGVFYTTWWMIWIFCNKAIFGSSPQSKDCIVDDIVARSFSWCRSWRWRQKLLMTPSGLKSDGVNPKYDGVTIADKKKPI
ncbi:RNA-directed DNA polymerase, eukaryota [Tanacetum coccineum]